MLTGSKPKQYRYLNNVSREASRHCRKKKGYLKVNLMKLKLTVRSEISETCIVISVTLRRVTSLELI